METDVSTPEPPIPVPQIHRDLAAYAARGGWHSVQIPAEPLTEAAWCAWMAQAQVGEAIQYHDGFLLRDRSEAYSALTAQERARIHATARQAWIACERGFVHLFSLRIADSHYRYLAIRSGRALTSLDAPLRRRRPTSVSLTPVTH